MKRLLIIFSFLTSLSLTAGAGAQLGGAPDIREIPPVVMLLIDTSGSMERRLNCVCSTEACTECLPNCADSNVPLNRWYTLLSALTGTNKGVAQGCKTLTRIGYDAGYYIPHFHYPFLTVEAI